MESIRIIIIAANCHLLKPKDTVYRRLPILRPSANFDIWKYSPKMHLYIKMSIFGAKIQISFWHIFIQDFGMHYPFRAPQKSPFVFHFHCELSSAIY